MFCEYDILLQNCLKYGGVFMMPMHATLAFTEQAHTWTLFPPWMKLFDQSVVFVEHHG